MYGICFLWNGYIQLCRFWPSASVQFWVLSIFIFYYFILTSAALFTPSSLKTAVTISFSGNSKSLIRLIIKYSIKRKMLKIALTPIYNMTCPVNMCKMYNYLCFQYLSAFIAHKLLLLKVSNIKWTSEFDLSTWYLSHMFTFTLTKVIF